MFDGGYAQDTSANSTTDKFAFYYYNQDHLGNNREVVDANGVVQQVTNYYPFGAPYVDATAVKCDSLQPYKYNGKELDLMHGLNTYDYGARQHDPILCRWDRIDPLCETYYDSTPYAYCGNTPSNMVDYDGCDYWSTNDPDQIRAFINALGSGQTQFDFSGWNHATDAEICGNLTYNDVTHKFYTSYTSVVDGELTVIGKSFDANLTPVSFSGMGYEGAFVYKPITNPLLKVAYALEPLTYYDGWTNWTCNTDGRITGIAFIKCIADFGRNGMSKSAFIKSIIPKGFKLVKGVTSHGEKYMNTKVNITVMTILLIKEVSGNS